MADKAISELVSAPDITETDLFVLEQNGTAKKLTGQVLINWLTRAADGHGGIQNISKIGSFGLVDTYRITLADTTTVDFDVTNGRAITSVTETAVSGLTRTYTIAFNDGSSETFAVTDGRSITGIAKTGSSGLTDTYTVTYNDGTTYEFTVTNGAKGDKGDNTYTHIKFASQEPTEASHSMGDIPDRWIGFCWGGMEEAPTDWSMYKWYEIKGEKGDTGDAATLQSSAVEYQVSDSGTIIPSGSWSTSVPMVAQGKYLWTRTTTTFNTGNPVVSYSVSRMGLDGSGSVSSVANISPDSNGNVPLIPADVGALAATGGDLTGELRMNGQPISGLNPPTEDSQAANMGFVNQQVRRAAPRNLLDNSDFRNPVNQRAITNGTSVDAYAYFIDRWTAMDTPVAPEMNPTGLYVSGGIRQIMNNLSSLVGKNVTIVCNFIDGLQMIASGVVTDKGNWGTVCTSSYNATFMQLIDSAVGEWQFVVSGFPDRIVHAAIYEGEYTADTLPTYQPKGFAAELMECMRYYQTVQILAGTEVFTSRRQFIQLPIPMRVVPTLTVLDLHGGPEFYSVSAQDNRTLDATGAETYTHGTVGLSADL